MKGTSVWIARFEDEVIGVYTSKMVAEREAKAEADAMSITGSTRKEIGSDVVVFTTADGAEVFAEQHYIQ